MSHLKGGEQAHTDLNKKVEGQFEVQDIRPAWSEMWGLEEGGEWPFCFELSARKGSVRRFSKLACAWQLKLRFTACEVAGSGLHQHYSSRSKRTVEPKATPHTQDKYDSSAQKAVLKSGHSRQDRIMGLKGETNEQTQYFFTSLPVT